MSYSWFQELWWVFGFTVSMLLTGLLIGHVFFCLFLACLLYLSWHLYNLYRLYRWFGKEKKRQLPEAPGIWGEVFYRFYRLQQRNRKRKRKLALILRSFRRSTAAMPDAVVVLGTNPNYEIAWFNKAAQTLLGLKACQDRGQPLCNLIRYPKFCEYLHQGDKDTSIQLVSPANPNIMLRISIVPYASNNYLLLARDITQLHRLEQIRRDFVANISHELRTPLTVVAGFIETMSDTEDEGLHKWQRPLVLMAQQTARMRCIVDDLLMLSRLESEPTPSRIELVDVANMLTNIHEEARILSGERHHQFTLEVDDNLLMYGHPGELRSAFSNLIFNAVRYTPAGGDIIIRWYNDERVIHFEIRDTGEGIAPEHLPRLAERFYRVDVGRSRNQGGTGLGLAIVKHVLNRHAGHLHIESTVGKGSVFRCDFPNTFLSQPLDDILTIAEGKK
ncbi:MAG: hypothetical protein BWK79_04330 [Beggiatoa sp. IS2]|nr:MAG: hypothetical protein BWK79_04330 [Beggiatoa sp. IS2]